MNTYNVSNIVWDTDGQAVDLPANAIVECDDEDEIAETLTDAYGWCVISFNYDAEDDEDAA